MAGEIANRSSCSDGQNATLPARQRCSACPLCQSNNVGALLETDGRHYWACRSCDLRFLDSSQLPSAHDEYAHYLLHENDAADPRYRRFLAKLADPLLARLAPTSRGLDYGCGPGPALAAMLGEAGHSVALYDPFFHPDRAVLDHTYDFVTATEVAEHFHTPDREFERLMGLVRPGGWLAIMTCFQTDDARFAGWHYRTDPTHVVFYRETTFRWLAAAKGWTCTIPIKDVALLQRPAIASALGP